MAWNDENTALLKDLWAKGLSAGVISMRIPGVSRNAVIGKVHRLKLPGRATPIGKSRLGGRKSAALQRARRKTKPQESIRFGKVKSYEPVAVNPLPPEPPKPSKLFKLVDMDDDQCRFIYGDPKQPGGGYCGCKTAVGSAYCAGHRALVWKSETVKTRTPADVPRNEVTGRALNPRSMGDTRSLRSVFA